jgi:thioredoxin-like negative regulator of GroEL
VRTADSPAAPVAPVLATVVPRPVAPGARVAAGAPAETPRPDRVGAPVDEHAPGESPAEAAVTALESGLEALRRRDLPAAVAAFRRARYLDADLVEAGLHLGRAHEAAGDVRGARSAYQGVLHQITGGRPEILRGRAATTDVAAACEARLQALPET